MTGRTVVIAGATGLVGRNILEGLLADRTVVAVHSLVRRAPAIRHPKLTVDVVDFAALPTLPPADEVYLALGTTIKVAGSQAAFRAIDYDANLAVATAALAAGARKAGSASAMGADSELEGLLQPREGRARERVGADAVRGFGRRAPIPAGWEPRGLGQPTRRGEELGFALGKALGFLIPANYKPIEAAAVARALLSAVPSGKGKKVLLSGAMQREALRPQ